MPPGRLGADVGDRPRGIRALPDPVADPDGKRRAQGAGGDATAYLAPARSRGAGRDRIGARQQWGGRAGRRPPASRHRRAAHHGASQPRRTRGWKPMCGQPRHLPGAWHHRARRGGGNAFLRMGDRRNGRHGTARGAARAGGGAGRTDQRQRGASHSPRCAERSGGPVHGRHARRPRRLDARA